MTTNKTAAQMAASYYSKANNNDISSNLHDGLTLCVCVRVSEGMSAGAGRCGYMFKTHTLLVLLVGGNDVKLLSTCEICQHRNFVKCLTVRDECVVKIYHTIYVGLESTARNLREDIRMTAIYPDSKSILAKSWNDSN